MSLIRCENAAFAYDGKTVVSALSFAVEAGEYLCIVGENGSGKSTLMKGILGLKKPVAGTVEFGGGLQRSQIGYLPQQTDIQRDFPATVFEVALSGCLNTCGLRPFFTQKQKQRALQNLRRLEISGLKDRCYKELSGGQQQRVLLARALCATEKLLLLDEPAAGLDPLATVRLYDIIADVCHKEKVTVIMVSHDIHSAMHSADKILHIGHDRAFFGTTREYQSSGLFADLAKV